MEMSQKIKDSTLMTQIKWIYTDDKNVYFDFQQLIKYKICENLFHLHYLCAILDF